ncbi:ABC transporter ATP-binding protein [Georgenia thermotolerans]|uniref:ATP-binding cassette domain-containing protein n=1 Tax=Georgenia thermotolerans TaxID=527326 RepID=A0A7J5UUX6_9MICO|nr:ABC transporter ATP-binding protein [Georgenia thermotolerans]KAE8766078.1 ATP-binding cassette domain-containing protein [Georgenia thermotolerans]
MTTLTAPATTAVAAEARAIVKTYGRGATEVRALDGADLRLPVGRFTAVMGPSGSGKSTLMHALAGLDTVDSGQILLGGTDLTTLDEEQRTLLRRQRVGFVFQSFNLVPSLTAAENIALPLTLAAARPDKAWLAELVDVVGLTDRLGHRPTELSGGQQQRVAVARALVARPDIVFADEPTGNLDSRAGEAVLGLLGYAAHDLGQTIVMVTHDPGAAAHADRVVFLADGRIVDEVDRPGTAAILDRMARLGAGKE